MRRRSAWQQMFLILAVFTTTVAVASLVYIPAQFDRSRAKVVVIPGCLRSVESMSSGAGSNGPSATRFGWAFLDESNRERVP